MPTGRRHKTADNDEHRSVGGSHKAPGKQPIRGLSRERFFRSFSSAPRPMHLLLFVLFLILGFALTTTVRTQASDPLAGLNEDQLVALLGDLDQRERALRSERNSLQAQLTELKEAADAQQAALDAVASAKLQAEIAAGTVPVQGPGIVMWVTGRVDSVPVSVFTTTLAELRNAGAESISINDVRLNGRAWFGKNEDGDVIANGTLLEPPYEWRAIGDSSTLLVAMEIRGGAVSQYRAYGAAVSTEAKERIEITATAPSFDPQWARPVVD